MPNGELIPLRNNAAGQGTGLKLVLNNLSDEFFPGDNRRRGYNVSTLQLFSILFIIVLKTYQSSILIKRFIIIKIGVRYNMSFFSYHQKNKNYLDLTYNVYLEDMKF